ncbi:LOW QUALITY PROTEIN: uncharacterized protein PS065_014584 [Dugong dugon]
MLAATEQAGDTTGPASSSGSVVPQPGDPHTAAAHQSKVMSCPTCLELFTPPVLLLPCSRNFCRQCLELILVYQNCTHFNGQFCCPVCRKVMYLRGRGTNGLQRNILAENILEKFKEEVETLHTKEQNQLSQMCEKHGEITNLMCVSTEETICRMCKLFGDHKSHQVSKISDAYTERKVSFAEDIQLVLQKFESTGQAGTSRLCSPKGGPIFTWKTWLRQSHAACRPESQTSLWRSFLRKYSCYLYRKQRLIGELRASTADMRAMINAVGNNPLSGIKCLIATLKKQLESEHSSKLEKLQLVARELEAPHRRLYQQMKLLLEQHVNAVQFLHKDKKLKAEMERLMEGSLQPQVPTKDNISIRHYFHKLIRIDITDFILPKTEKNSGQHS